MIVRLNKWVDRAKFLLIFIVLTFVLYQLLSVLSVWMEPVQRYKQPSGGAVKVFQPEAGTMDARSMPDRLRLFYWYGE